MGLDHCEEIDNPRMRGRKLCNQTWNERSYREEIDNPRMRGRKLKEYGLSALTVKEEIDNPRMRGRKLVDVDFKNWIFEKKLIIPG